MLLRTVLNFLSESQIISCLHLRLGSQLWTFIVFLRPGSRFFKYFVVIIIRLLVGLTERCGLILNYWVWSNIRSNYFWLNLDCLLNCLSLHWLLNFFLRRKNTWELCVTLVVIKKICNLKLRLALSWVSLS